MDKSYFLMLDTSGVLLAFLYIVPLSLSLAYISKKIDAGFTMKSIMILFFYYYLFFLIGTFIPWVPDFPDTDLFAKIIAEDYYPPNQSLGVRLFYLLMYPIRLFSLFKVEIFMVFQIFMFILSLMFFWKSWQIVLTHVKQEKNMGIGVFMFLAALYPSFLLFIPIPLREFMVLFGFSIMIYGLVERYYNHQGLLWVVLGSVLLMFGRPQLIVIVVIFLSFFQHSKRIRYTLLALGVFAIPLLFTSILGYKFTPEFFEYLRNRGCEKQGVMGYGDVHWQTYWDILHDMPGLVFQFILSPFPILHERNPLQFLAILIDAIYSIIIYVSVLYAGLRVSKIYLFIFVISASLFAVWEYHIAGAPRHRMPLVAMLLPVASYGLLKMYQDIRNKYDI